MTDESHVRVVVERFYRGFLAADVEALAEVVEPKAVWIVPFETVLSGTYRGPEGIVALREQIAHATAGTWRPLRDDSVDVAASSWHGVVLDRYLAEREGRRLDSHEAIVAAMEDGRIVRLFHYLHDPAAFTAFWAL